MKTIIRYLLIVSVGLFTACDYLDVVPDNIPTLDNAFRDKMTAEKYLNTCYSYLPNHGDVKSDPGMNAGDEIWVYYPLDDRYTGARDPWQIARGLQNRNDPYSNYWDGGRSGKAMFQAIRDCNIFLKNIVKVPDIDEALMKRWIAEVKFLKAYYHFWLMRMYGPIPIIETNLPISTSVEGVQIYRESVDHVVEYIVSLLNEAIPDLPIEITKFTTELGRVTQPIAKTIKAKTLVWAASPLVNGNSDLQITDNKGENLVAGAYDQSKWELALDACNDALLSCTEAGVELYEISSSIKLPDEIKTELSIRGAVTSKWNKELIWGGTNGNNDELQRICMPRFITAHIGNQSVKSLHAPTMRMAELFYSNNGVPISEDKDWDYTGRFETAEADTTAPYYVEPGYTTSKLNMSREPRYYADMSFDGGLWYGQGLFNGNDLYRIHAKYEEGSGKLEEGRYSVTGYYAKKLIHPETESTSTYFATENYPFPIIRLADLLLMCAEAENEVNGPGANAYKYLDMIRSRAGLDGVVESWTKHSTLPDKPKSKEGLREIIQQERLIELAFEGQRFWDIRRWKLAKDYMNKPIRGWDVHQSDVAAYYRVVDLFNGSSEDSYEFEDKDYLWPLKEYNTLVNENLVQNPGW
ncbi:RagB/SusD family nutrient uptake outer membrane protein [Puteibacter caeruleilacunae]|nr:RagB/SusD family nutrient uptake outer membrane protein [Puteibacter caeruleilacunae]